MRPELFHAGPLQGIGLLGMQERLESLGGRLEIESGFGQGAQLTAVVPWQVEG